MNVLDKLNRTKYWTSLTQQMDKYNSFILKGCLKEMGIPKRKQEHISKAKR